MGTVVMTYSCQSMRPPTVVAGRFFADYMGNGGSWGDQGNYTPANNAMDGPFVPCQQVGPGVGGPAGRSGMERTMGDITDGTSNTLQVGERWLPKEDIFQTAADCANDQGYVDGWDNDSIRFARATNTTASNASSPPVTPQVCSRVNPSGLDTCSQAYGSPHPTFLASFCDGSVHSIRFDINANVFWHLCKINDGFQD